MADTAPQATRVKVPDKIANTFVVLHRRWCAERTILLDQPLPPHRRDYERLPASTACGGNINFTAPHQVH
ncbi:hypothetical protein QTQ03_28570 [Micromonospora sp. WMMA1363]|uniref:hypothetical protein n=1 Tax=Micromonospora sp. WMMA1363 TaxID=3053985 RepID=UPI00259C9314|nr:hypothetical protein [Micromonospora sp. WMMA1363]MDM4723362.1 hypothetical protein [Micromonospora sp. WMMA1363]